MTGTSSLVSAIVLAAGTGSRMRSTTPKVLHRIAGRTLVEHAVRAVAGVEPEQIVVVVGHGGDQVAEHLSEVAKTIGRPVGVASTRSSSPTSSTSTRATTSPTHTKKPTPASVR